MKNFIAFCVLSFSVFVIGSIHACKKDTVAPVYQTPTDPPPPPPQVPPVTTSYTEEFDDFNSLYYAKGWVFSEYSQADTIGTTAWTVGAFGSLFKGDSTWYGFTPFSSTSSPVEYVYSYDPAMDSNLSISSWMLSPILTVKNDDKISFYTRGDTNGVYTNRMQVLMDTLASTNVGHDLNSVGGFTTKLFDINPSQAPGGYPLTWTKYEYTFSGFTAKKNIRIAFRHYVIHPTNARGIGIDQFKFEVK
jgi:hypothetical protein